MWIFAAISAVMSLVQGYQQMKSEKQLAKRQEELANEAKGIADQNALRIEAENLEQSRRLDAQQKTEEGKARAYAGASGFADDSDTGSIALSLSSQKSENAKQLAYLKSAGASQAGIARAQGDYSLHQGQAMADASRERAKAALWGGVAKAGASIATIGFGSGGSSKSTGGSSIFAQSGTGVPVEERDLSRF